MSTCAECKTIPPVLSEGYEAKGSYKQVGGLRTYVTGNTSSTKAILDIYDIFGIASQTLQGADGIAAALDVLVIVPDFFEKEGGGAKAEWYSNPSEEDQKAKDAFYATAMDFPFRNKKLLEYTTAAKSEFSGVTSWGAFGLCWGGKLAALSSASPSPFKVTGQVHPGGFSSDDARKMTIPHICLPSKGEALQIANEYKEILEANGNGSVVERYPTMNHGWMGARANLAIEENKKEYERGYNQLAAFFAKHL